MLASKYDAGTAEPLRLVVVTHYFPEHRGGIELVAAALVRELTQSGKAVVEWFASDCDMPPAGASITPRPVPAWNGVEAHTGLPYPLWFPTAWPSLWRAIRGCDLVHVHDYIYMGNLLAVAMSKLARRPCVITQHVGNVPLASRFLRGLLRLANTTLGHLVLRSSAATVFVSNMVQRQFFHTGNEQVHVIANGVDNTTFYPLSATQRSALRVRLGFAEDRPMILFVGRFVAKKGLPLLKNLVPRMPRIQWAFAGRGPLDPGKWKNPAVCVFHDRAGATLAELYQAADLLVLPSVGEGFPLVIQEAMACGTPVLAGKELSGALPDLDQVLMTEDVESADALEKWQTRIAALLDDPISLTEQRQVVAEFVPARWSWDFCAAAYLGLYRSAISE